MMLLFYHYYYYYEAIWHEMSNTDDDSQCIRRTWCNQKKKTTPKKCFIIRFVASNLWEIVMVSQKVCVCILMSFLSSQRAKKPSTVCGITWLLGFLSQLISVIVVKLNRFGYIIEFDSHIRCVWTSMFYLLNNGRTISEIGETIGQIRWYRVCNSCKKHAHMVLFINRLFRL